jgi:hypothetical protein
METDAGAARRPDNKRRISTEQTMTDHPHRTIVIRTSLNGCITWCPSCRTLFVEFMTVALRLTPEGFDSFCRFVGGIDLDRCERLNRRRGSGRRPVAIELVPSGIIMVLTRTEAEELREMLDGAAWHIAYSRPDCWPDYDRN